MCFLLLLNKCLFFNMHGFSMATREFYLRKKFTVTAAQYAGGESAYMVFIFINWIQIVKNFNNYVFDYWLLRFFFFFFLVKKLHTASDDFSNVFIGGYHAQKETYFFHSFFFRKIIEFLGFIVFFIVISFFFVVCLIQLY